MAVYYTTVTSKGQITLPAAIRSALGVRTGDRVRVRLRDDKAIVEPGATLDSLRARIKAEAQAQGTWGTTTVSGDGWAAHVEEDRAES